MTFSIVVYRPNDGSGGVAVATRSLAVGALVPAVESGAGALATQACTNVSYRPTGLSAGVCLRRSLLVTLPVAISVAAKARLFMWSAPMVGWGTGLMWRWSSAWTTRPDPSAT